MFDNKFREHRFTVRPLYKGTLFKELTRKKKIELIKFYYKTIEEEFEPLAPNLTIDDKDTLDEVLMFLSSLYKEHTQISLTEDGLLSKSTESKYFCWATNLNPFYKERKNKELFNPLISLLFRVNEALGMVITSCYFNEMLDEMILEKDSYIYQECLENGDEMIADFHYMRKEVKYKKTALIDHIRNINFVFNDKTYSKLIDKYPGWASFIKGTLTFLKTEIKPIAYFNEPVDDFDDGNNLILSASFIQQFGDSEYNNYIDRDVQNCYENAINLPIINLTSKPIKNFREQMEKDEKIINNAFWYWENVMSHV